MLDAKVTSTKTHETRFVIEVDRERLKAIITEGLREIAGVPRYTAGLSCVLPPDLDADRLTFVLIQDHDWYLRPNTDDA